MKELIACNTAELGHTLISNRPSTFEEVLQALRDNRPDEFGSVRMDPLNACNLRFSRVLRVRIHGCERCWYAFVKIRKPLANDPASVQLARQRVALEFAALSDVNSTMAGHVGLSTVRPIACFPEHLALVTEEASGRTLRRVLNQPMFWRSKTSVHQLTTIFERLGTWIRLFQKTGQRGAQISLEKMRSYLEERLNILVRSGAASFNPADRDSTLRHFDALCREIPKHDLYEVRIHADFCPDNVLVDGTDITVLDFTTVGSGALYHDLAYMFMHIESVKVRPWISNRTVDHLQSAMLRAFDPEFDQGQPLFRLLQLQHIVCRLVQMSTTSPPLVKSLYRSYAWRRYWTWLRALKDL